MAVIVGRREARDWVADDAEVRRGRGASNGNKTGGAYSQARTICPAAGTWEGIMEQRSLYDRLGGMEAVTAVVEDFVGRAAGDGRINGKFARTDVPRLKAMLIEQVSAASGGPGPYTGRGMRETHDGMGVTAGEFDALVGDLVATLDKFNVPATEQQELLGILGPLRSDIVEVEVATTGTPLPDSYQAAPPLAHV
jgi:hemoglobin